MSNSKKIKLIFALGNPGVEFQDTYHNIAKSLLLDFARKQEVEFKPNNLFLSDLAQIKFAKVKTNLAWGHTFMNQSGQSLVKVKTFLKLKNEEILVMRDDSDLEFGKLRTIFNSSSGGHKGLESVIRALRGKNFWQLKIGIRNPKELNLKSRKKAGALVLKKLFGKEAGLISKNQNKIFEFIENFIRNPQKNTFNFTQ